VAGGDGHPPAPHFTILRSASSAWFRGRRRAADCRRMSDRMSDGRFPSSLAPLVGRWSVAMATHGPDGPVRADGLTAEKRWFADGRYVQEVLAGAFAGAHHEKRTLLGLNPTRGRYEYVTADNHDAVLLLYTGRPGAAGDERRLDLWAEYVSPGDAAPRGVLLTVRTTLTVVSDDEHTLANFYAEPGQPERPFLEYHYRRTA
jgi:hypothetical protein